MLLRKICALFFVLLCLTSKLHANTCVVKTINQWNALSATDNCTTVDLAGNTLRLNASTRTLLFDQAKFPQKVVLSNGTIDGSDRAVADCVKLLHQDVRLTKIRITGCSRHGIQVGDPNAAHSQPARNVVLDNLTIDTIGNHGIYIGRHNQPTPVNDLIRITDTNISNIGVDGIAGSIGPRALLDIQRTRISRVDQRIKNLLSLDAGLDRFCKHPSLGVSGGDCIHVQPVLGSIKIEQNLCDHTDVPTKNGFILQNQNRSDPAGTINVSDNRILMSRSCLTVSGRSNDNNIKPNGIQIENIENIKIDGNTISQVFNGISLNGRWTKATCSIAENSITAVDQRGQPRANVHFNGSNKNCNPDTQNAVEARQTKQPAQPPPPASSIVWSRNDITPTEVRWLATDANGIQGHMWVNGECGRILTSNPDLQQRRGDWNDMVRVAPGGRPVVQPPCVANDPAPTPRSRRVFHRADADEFRLIRTDNNRTYHHWINHDCAAQLQRELQTIRGTWNEMVLIAPFNGGPWRCP